LVLIGQEEKQRKLDKKISRYFYLQCKMNRNCNIIAQKNHVMLCSVSGNLFTCTSRFC